MKTTLPLRPPVIGAPQPPTSSSDNDPMTVWSFYFLMGVLVLGLLYLIALPFIL